MKRLLWKKSVNLCCVHIYEALASLVALGGILTAQSVEAGPAYNVMHKFNLNIRGNQVYRGTWFWDNHDRATSTVAPPDFDDGPPPGTLANAVPGANDMAVRNVVSDGANAHASAGYTANAAGAGDVHISGGGACGGNCTLARAEGGSALNLNRGTIDRKGNLTWSPNWTLVVVRTGGIGDPVDLSFQDLDTSDVQSSRLFDLDLDLEGGDGSSTNVNGDVTISGIDGSFHLNQLSPYLVNGTGAMSLAFQNGIVTASADSGIYAGLLPAVGTSSSAIGFHLGDAAGNINLDFDFGTSNTSGYDMSAQFGNSGFVDATAEVPEPAALVLASLGLLMGGMSHCRQKRGSLIN